MKAPPRVPPDHVSDATFWADGTVTRHAYYGAAQAWWWRLAGWKIAAVKLGALTAAAAIGWGLLLHRDGTARTLAVLTGGLLGAGLIRLVIWREQWGHYRSVIRPLHHMLAGIVDAPPRPRDWITVPLDYATDKSKIGRAHV